MIGTFSISAIIFGADGVVHTGQANRDQRRAASGARGYLAGRYQPLLAAAAAAIVFSLFSALAPTSLDNYVLLADAWLHGHLWVAHLPGPWIDAMPYHGRYYIIEAPAPAILLLPFVAIFGTSTNQTVLGVALAAISAFGVWRLSEYLGLSRWLSVLLVAFLSFGTSLGFCAAYGAVWFVAHLSAVAFTMLALAEIYGSERGWVVSLWAVLAALSRYPLILALPVYAVLLYLRTRSTSVLFGYCALLIPAVVAYAAYNYARWGMKLARFRGELLIGHYAA